MVNEYQVLLMLKLLSHFVPLYNAHCTLYNRDLEVKENPQPYLYCVSLAENVIIWVDGWEQACWKKRLRRKTDLEEEHKGQS